MQNLYNSDMITLLTEKNKKDLFISLIPLAVIIPLYVFFLIVAEEYNQKVYQVFSTILFTAWSWIFIFELTFNILPNKRKIEHITKVLKVNKVEFEGKVETISDVITLEKSVLIKEILIIKEYERHKLYMNVDLNECNIKKGDYIKATVGNNFIYSYEVIDND